MNDYGMQGRGRSRRRYDDNNYEGASYVSGAKEHPHEAPNHLPTFMDSEVVGKETVNKLHQVWSLWKKCEAICQMLRNAFDSSPNPYQTALYILANSCDFHQPKTSGLTLTVIDEFKKWISGKEVQYSSCLTSILKYDVYYTLMGQKKKNINMISRVIKIFQVDEERLSFKDHIKLMLLKGQFREAALSVTALGLQDQYDVEEILVPLVFQDQPSAVEEYLEGCSQQQKELVSYLDHLLAVPNLSDEIFRITERRLVANVQHSKLKGKTLSKLVARLAKMYDLPEEITPNLYQRRAAGHMNFLMYKKYIEKDIGMENWEELIRESVGSDIKMQEDLLYKMLEYNDPEGALYWARKLNVPKRLWPASLLEEAEGYSPQVAVEEETESWDDCDQVQSNELVWDCNTQTVYNSTTSVDSSLAKNYNSDGRKGAQEEVISYHRLKLPLTCFTIVDTLDLYCNFLQQMKKEDIVGFDSEWKPTCGTTKPQVDVIQVATRRHIYIIDVLSLLQKLSESEWKCLGEEFFSSRSPVKLGFNPSGDITIIASSIPGLQNIKQDFANLIDICRIWKLLSSAEYQVTFPYQDPEAECGSSLSSLVELCFGHPLDKCERFSNWARRPLRNTQLIYAALDAFCLLEIFDLVERLCINQNINFNEVYVASLEKPSSKKYSRTKERQPQARVNNTKKTPNLPEETPSKGERSRSPPHSPRSLRIVCDTMLQGLGRQLRTFGADTIILGNGEDHDKCIELAQKEDRIILTRGHVYQRLSKFVPQGHCYLVHMDAVEEQVQEVFSYCNIRATKEDIFTRCLLCNGDEYVRIPQHIMIEIAASRGFCVDGDDVALIACDAGKKKSKKGHERPVPHNWGSCVLMDVMCQKVKSGAPIQVDKIPGGILCSVVEFFVCQGCGKCYWDGGHFERLLQGRFKSVISD